MPPGHELPACRIDEYLVNRFGALGRTSTPYYNTFVNEKFKVPNLERLSVVVATILLAFAITQFIREPAGNSSFDLGGFIIPFNFNLSTLITIAIAGMTASGADWILRDHPNITGKSTLPHLLIPAISAWVQSVILNNMADTPGKWVAFTFGGVFLLMVILAEYIVIFPDDYRKPIAIALLTAFIYATLLALLVALDSADQRLIISLPAVGLATGILSMRIFQFQSQKEWPFLHSLVCLLVTTQVAAALHYLPISPISHGLILLGTIYFTINFILSLDRGVTTRRALIESLIPQLLIWLVAIWIN